jgi:hypothetical protein
MGFARLKKREILLLDEIALLVGLKLIEPKVPGFVAWKVAVQVIYEGCAVEDWKKSILAVTEMLRTDAGLRAFSIVIVVPFVVSLPYRLEYVSI